MENNFTGCEFTQSVSIGADDGVVELLQTVARGLVGIVELCKGCNVTLGPMVRIDPAGVSGDGVADGE